MLPTDELLKERLAHEVDILKELEHPNIIRLSESFDDLLPGKLHMVMEVLPGTTLRNVLDTRGALSEAEVVPIARQLLSALEYLHTTVRYVHRDLKPENVMPAAELPDAKSAEATAPLPLRVHN